MLHGSCFSCSRRTQWLAVRLPTAVENGQVADRLIAGNEADGNAGEAVGFVAMLINGVKGHV